MVRGSGAAISDRRRRPAEFIGRGAVADPGTAAAHAEREGRHPREHASDEFRGPRRPTLMTDREPPKGRLDDDHRPPHPLARLLVLCLGDLMIVLDGTIVNVALPSIRDDLGFSQESLAWVVNAYLLTFGGFLLLGGRLGDLFGHRRLFLIGITLFTLASLACGSREHAGTARRRARGAGVGGAVVSAVALSLIMTLFVEPAERAKAMGVFGFVLSGGGTAGVLLGRRHHRRARLALDLPRQPPGRRRSSR